MMIVESDESISVCDDDDRRDNMMIVNSDERVIEAMNPIWIWMHDDGKILSGCCWRWCEKTW